MLLGGRASSRDPRPAISRRRFISPLPHRQPPHRPQSRRPSPPRPQTAGARRPPSCPRRPRARATLPSPPQHCASASLISQAVRRSPGRLPSTLARRLVATASCHHHPTSAPRRGALRTPHARHRFHGPWEPTLAIGRAAKSSHPEPLRSGVRARHGQRRIASNESC